VSDILEPAPQPAPPAKKSKWWLWVAIGLVLALCVTGLVSKRLRATAKAEAQASAQPSSSQVVNGVPEPIHASSKPASVTKLAIPATLTGYAKTTNKEQQKLVDTAVANLKAQGLPEVIGAAYGDPSKGKLRQFLAVRMTNSDPTGNLEAMKTAQAKLYSLTENAFKAANAGPLGGFATCALGRINGGDVTICIWGDLDTVGVVYFFNTTVAAAQPLFITARGEIETKS
jgi:hypothetical protein